MMIVKSRLNGNNLDDLLLQPFGNGERIRLCVLIKRSMLRA